MRLEATKDTPFVHLESGFIEIHGRSIAEDPKGFYQPVYDWVDDYVVSPPETTKVVLNFEYINTASTKWVYNILKIFGDKFDPKKELNISWYYERGDDDMLELGKIFETLTKRSFQYIETEE
jgi:hypothetical protein